MREFKRVFQIACIYITTIIGAGFASGQEIMRFFSTYHKGGLWGIILAGFLFALIGSIILKKVYTERIRNYEELLFPMTGWFFGWIMEIAVSIFLLVLFVVMIAGGGTILHEKLGIPFVGGIIAMTLICMSVLLYDLKGLTLINTYSAPVLTIGLILIGIYIIVSKDTDAFSVSFLIREVTDNWIFSSLLYVSYNSLMSVVVMSSLLPLLASKKAAILGGMTGGVMLGLVAVLLNFVIGNFYPQVFTEEIPVLKIIENYSEGISGVYSLILWIAMFSSAINAGYCFTGRLAGKVRVGRNVLVTLLSFIAVPMACLGFSSLIAGFYPLFGYAGLFMVFLILFEGLKSI